MKNEEEEEEEGKCEKEEEIKLLKNCVKFKFWFLKMKLIFKVLKTFKNLIKIWF